MANWLLAAAAAGVCGTWAIQDYLIPKLRQQSISSGLTGKYHWYLDAAFVALSTALVLAFSHGSLAQEILGYAAAVFLVLTGASGTYTTWLDQYTKNNGEKIHAALTACTFVAALLLQAVSNHGAGLWGITVLGISSAIATHFLVANASVTEKVGVIGLCGWLAAWAFI